MRGALGFGTRVSVGPMATAVLPGPNSGVGDGPPVTVIGGGVGEMVGVAAKPGVRVGDGVYVCVSVGRAVGMTGKAAAPQPERRTVRLIRAMPETRRGFKTPRLPKNLETPEGVGLKRAFSTSLEVSGFSLALGFKPDAAAAAKRSFEG